MKRIVIAVLLAAVPDAAAASPMPTARFLRTMGYQLSGRQRPRADQMAHAGTVTTNDAGLHEESASE